jgi:hypothetical protein
MRLPWSKPVEEINLEPSTGDDAMANNVVERKLGLGRIGT